MHAIGNFFVHLITALFFIGLAGSLIVIVISFVEDFHELFGPDEPNSGPEGSSSTGARKSTG